MKFNLTLLLALLVYGSLHAQAAFSEGVKLLKSNQFVAAEEKFFVAIEKGKSSPAGLKMAYIYLGFSFNGQKKFSKAVESFSKSIAIDSLDPATYTDRALAYSYQNDYENAIKDFKHVLKLDSTGDQAEAAHFYLGRIYLKQLDNKAAINHLNRLLNLVPTDAEGYFLRAIAKSNVMDIDGSIEDYDMAIKYKRNYMEAYANRGVQKINKLPTEKKTGKQIDCLEDPCSDLLKAKSMGDATVDDMIYLYCQKCQ